MEDRPDLHARTKDFALRIIRVCGALPERPEARVIRNQLVRSGTSVGAHHREAKGSRSLAEFLSKMEVALQELEETSYWLELLNDLDFFPPYRLGPLRAETDELIAIFVSSIVKAKQRSNRKP